ncbi:MAG: hypothetical protein Fur0046_13850 [Cyanobacteria bacterium J069]
MKFLVFLRQTSNPQVNIFETLFDGHGRRSEKVWLNPNPKGWRGESGKPERIFKLNAAIF